MASCSVVGGGGVLLELFLLGGGGDKRIQHRPTGILTTFTIAIQGAFWTS